MPNRLLSMADVVRESRIPRHRIVYGLQVGAIREPMRLNGRRVFNGNDLTQIVAFFTKRGNR